MVVGNVVPVSDLNKGERKQQQQGAVKGQTVPSPWHNCPYKHWLMVRGHKVMTANICQPHRSNSLVKCLVFAEGMASCQIIRYKVILVFELKTWFQQCTWCLFSCCNC